jgi:phage terminase large subunit GpA-like protein
MTDADKLLKIWRESWEPPARESAPDWCQKHINEIPYSPIPGGFKIENGLHMRQPMEAVADPRYSEVCLLAGIQSSKTLIMEASVCNIVKNNPGPARWFRETDQKAEMHAKKRLYPLFGACDPVRELLPKDRTNQRKDAVFFTNGMTLDFKGAHNIDNLQSDTLRYVFGDEVWNWPQGHMEEAKGRVTAFGWLGKCIWASQGGYADDDWDRKFKTSSQHELTFECPYCGHRQPFLLSQVDWGDKCKDANGNYNFDLVHNHTVYNCAACEKPIADTPVNRRRIGLTFDFVQMNPNASKRIIGFHWNSIATMPWGEFAELYIRAKLIAKKGDLAPLEQFYQKRLAQPWDDEAEDFGFDVPTQPYEVGVGWNKEGWLTSKQRVVERDDKLARVPLRFLCVDVQSDHMWITVSSWATNGQSRLLWFEKSITWEDIEAVQERFSVHPPLVFCDSGYNAYVVYEQCGKRGWTALKGDQRESFIFRKKLKDGRYEKTYRYYAPKKIVSAGAHKCAMYHYAANSVRDVLQRLRTLKNGDEQMWQLPEGLTETEDGKGYLRQLDSERRMKEGKKWVWKRIGKRHNHYFDCAVMSVVAALMLKVIGEESVDISAHDDERDT